MSRGLGALQRTLMSVLESSPEDVLALDEVIANVQDIIYFSDRRSLLRAVKSLEARSLVDVDWNSNLVALVARTASSYFAAIRRVEVLEDEVARAEEFENAYWTAVALIEELLKRPIGEGPQVNQPTLASCDLDIESELLARRQQEQAIVRIHGFQ
jgi:hypothetical protein